MNPLVEWVKDGRLPLRKIVKFCDTEDSEWEISDMQSGQTIKPVVL